MFKQIVKSVLGVRPPTKADLFIYLLIFITIFFFFLCLFVLF